MTARFLVHLCLVATFVATFVPLLIFGLADRNTIHVTIACLFFGLVLVHLAQRRHTAARLGAQLVRLRSRAKGQRGLAVSDTVLVVLVANVLASGIWDYASGFKLEIPGLHHLGYHTVASVLLLGYLLAHVLRRRRFRSSVIR